MDADRSLPESMALWELPEDHIGISLGDRWLPAGPRVFDPVPVGPEHTGRFAEFETVCQEFFDRILYGDPTEEVDRFLKSVSEGRPQ